MEAALIIESQSEGVKEMYKAWRGARAVDSICSACRASQSGHRRLTTRHWLSSQRSALPLKTSRYGWICSLSLAIGLGTSISLYLGAFGNQMRELHAEAPLVSLDIVPERTLKRKTGLSKENRDSISSQHLQVNKSWESPGVYAWGSNTGRVVAPDSVETLIKAPRRMPAFDGVLLRDLKLDRDFGVAVTEKGDLLQWGTAYSSDSTHPTSTLTGKDLVSVQISQDRVIGLSSSGKVYSLPVAKTDQLAGPKPREDSWIPFSNSRSPVSYRCIQPPLSSWFEQVIAISSGLEHLLLLTSSGRVFSSASSSTEFPSRGQMGIPGLTWQSRAPGPYDQPYEITCLKGFDICSIAAGDHHSLALDSQGRAFAFGDNLVGQLGFDYSSASTCMDVPSLIPIQKLYGSNEVPCVTSIAAGGVSSFFTVDAALAATRGQNGAATGPCRVTADTWSCGRGTFGGLGNGRWTHMQGTPTKVKALSSLYEFDETNKSLIPIRLSRLSVGSTHAAATMDNVTHVGVHTRSSDNDTNWGADVLWWGGNEFYQLGTRKRSNMSQPVYIPPLDQLADKEKGTPEERRFQIIPKKRVSVNGRWVDLEQRVECGRYVSAVYSRLC